MDGILPTLEELLEFEPPNPVPIKTKGSYSNVEEYLDIQYSLLREDFISPLRDLVRAVTDKNIDAQDKNNIFRNVQYVGVSEYNPDTPKSWPPSYCIQLQDDNNQMQKRELKLMERGLVILLTQDYKTMTIATITDLTYASVGQIGIKLITDVDMLHYKDKIFIMINNPSYLEAYIHALKLLKSPKAKQFKFQNYIINSENKTTKKSNYFINNLDISRIMKNRKSVVLNSDTEWPSFEETLLRKDQYDAFQRSLTEDLSIIQGPPGAGKSFLGIHLCHVLVPFCKKKGIKILIVSTTNSALDRFAMCILSENKGQANHKKVRFVRIGGCSTNEELKSYMLFDSQRNVNLSKSGKVQVLKDAQKCCRQKFCVATNNLKRLLRSRNMGDLVEAEVIGKYNDDEKKLPILISNDSLHDWLEIGDTKLNIITNTGYHYPGAYILNEKSTSNKSMTQIEVEEPSDMLLDDCDDNISSDESAEPKMMENGKENMKENTNNSERAKVCANYAVAKDITSDEYERLIEQPYQLTESQKWCVYKYWVNQTINHMTATLVGLKQRADTLNDEQCRNRSVYQQGDIKNYNVIISTITGVAKYHDILKDIGPCVVIAEEAADVIEANFIPCLMHDDVKKVILVGDHFQIKPHISVQRLAHKYNLDVSIFERFKNNGFEFNYLVDQQRMAPAISQFLTIIYTGLKDIKTEQMAKSIKGISEQCLYIHLDAAQEDMSETMTTSYSNNHEADFVCGLCLYLLQQGYKSKDVTILTPYKSQQQLIQNKLTFKLKNLAVKDTWRVDVSTVRSYQGNENRIVILSLVRTTHAGFVKENNNITGMISRAREGFYVVGNFQILRKIAEKSYWSEIIDKAKEKDLLHHGIKLVCTQHGNTTQVVDPADFERKCKEGGCKLKCNTKLKCGHPCQRICHPDDLQHQTPKTECRIQCGKMMGCGHTCKGSCHPSTGKHKICTSIVSKKRQGCRHEVNVKCHIATHAMKGYEKNKLCKEEVSGVYLDCRHDYKGDCHTIRTTKCKQNCYFVLNCGHGCQGDCLTCKGGRLHGKCMENECHHTCQAECSSKCMPCSNNYKVLEQTAIETMTDECLNKIDLIDKESCPDWISNLCHDLKQILNECHPSEFQINQVALEMERIAVALSLESTKVTMEQTLNEKLTKRRDTTLKALESNELFSYEQLQTFRINCPEIAPVETTLKIRDGFNNNNSSSVECIQNKKMYKITETQTVCSGCNQPLNEGHKITKDVLE